jgi:hypothetical protein
MAKESQLLPLHPVTHGSAPFPKRDVSVSSSHRMLVRKCGYLIGKLEAKSLIPTVVLMHRLLDLVRVKSGSHSQRPNTGSGLKFLRVLQMHSPVLLMTRL